MEDLKYFEREFGVSGLKLGMSKNTVKQYNALRLDKINMCNFYKEGDTVFINKSKTVPEAQNRKGRVICVTPYYVVVEFVGKAINRLTGKSEKWCEAFNYIDYATYNIKSWNATLAQAHPNDKRRVIVYPEVQHCY